MVQTRQLGVWGVVCRGRLSTSLSQWADAKTGLVKEAKELIAVRPGSAGQCWWNGTSV